MDRKALGFVAVLILLFVLLIILYFLTLKILDLKAEPVKFEEKKITEEAREQPIYSDELQFYPNMRFAKKNLIYNIDETCSDDKKTRIMQAFTKLEEETGMLKFYNNLYKEKADILIICQEENEEILEKYFIAGEGGPTEIINTSFFYIIEKGKVLLFYKKAECDNYNVELHELLHVFGFGHSQDKENIMYNISSCNQILTDNIIDELKRLYSIEELPDLYFSNVSALKHGSYLDFKVEVKNKGLGNADNIKLWLYSENVKVEEFDLGDINYGEGKFFWVENLKTGREVESIKFVLVSSREIEEKNNVAELILHA